MKYRVVTLHRSESDVRSIVSWIAERSLQAASSWLEVYDELLSFLAEHADSCGAAQECNESSIPLKESLFGTRRGRTYRAVFTIVGDEVRILRERGPGQPPLLDDEI